MGAGMIGLVQTPQELIVTDPPFAMIGYCLGAVALCLAIVAFLSRIHSPGGKWWVYLTLTIPFALLALALGASWTEIAFQGPKQRIEIREVRGYVFRKKRELSLSEVDQALVGRGRKTTGLVLRFRNGEEYIPGSFSDRYGYREAVDAINRYLELHRH